MLRAVRVAARSGFALESRTGNALRKCAGAVATIPLGRLRLELNALLAHGAAAEDIEEAVLVESAGAPVRQAEISAHALAQIAPSAPLFAHALPSRA